LDTSIWLDLFENRNEPHLPKGEWALRLVTKCVENGDTIMYSDMVVRELEDMGYPLAELRTLLEAWKPILMFVESSYHLVRRAKDLSAKRDVPLLDALHALLAREHHAFLVSLDHHFRKLEDITHAKSPKDLI